MTATAAQITQLDLGGVTATFVPDGEIRVEPHVAYPEGHGKLLADGLDLLDEDDRLLLSVGAILVTTPTHRVLIDAGIGDRTIAIERPGQSRSSFMRGGDLLDNLALLGVAPTDIDALLVTHLHADHIGWVGNENDAEPTFPRASHWVGDAEWRFWTDERNAGKATGPRGHELDIIRPRLRYLQHGEQPFDGIRAVATHGHTPGHFSFELVGRSRRAFVIGDAAHGPSELLHPEMDWAGDLDAAAAVSQRREVSQMLADSGVVVIGPHFPGDVFLQLRRTPTVQLDVAALD